MRFRVRVATRILCTGAGSATELRLARFGVYARLAAPAGPPDGVGVDAEAVLATLRRLWRIPWTGKAKEPFWRLVLDGMPTQARMHFAAGNGGCSCGNTALTDRLHHFWDCPPAKAVRTAIVAAAASAGHPLPELDRAHIWLARSPPGMHQGVWDVVALAAVGAMDKARRFMWAQRTDPTTHMQSGPILASMGAMRAVATFWELLQDFAAIGRIPAGPADGPALGTAHPFLCLPAPGARSVRVRVP